MIKIIGLIIMLLFENIEINGKVYYEPQPKQKEFHNAILNRAENGYREFLYGGAAKGGKAINIDTIIPTPDGYKKMKDIHPGDYVYSSEGIPTLVIWESDIDYKPEAYEIEFDTGEKIQCDGRHLWKTFTEKERIKLLKLSDEFREKRKQKRPSRAKDNPIKPSSQITITILNKKRQYNYIPLPTGEIRTTEEIFKTQRTNRHRINHTVCNSKPIKGAEKKLPIEPYLFGLWLGDGYSSAGRICMLEEDIENVLGLINEKAISKKVYYEGRNGKFCSYLIENLTTRLRKTGVLNNKHIPVEYLRSSYEQRLALLQGIMDSDGHCDKRGQCEIGFSDKNLAENVHELICSLGIKASIRLKELSKINSNFKNHYRIKFVTDIPVFRLKRKLERQNLIPSKKTKHRSIVSVKKCEPVPMKCIQIANPEGMYLITKSFIPTHNSWALRWEAHRNCLQYAGIKALLLRSSFPELERTHLRYIQFDLPSDVGQYNQQKHVFKYFNDSILEFGYGSSSSDLSQYLSANYDIILIDELTTIPFELSYNLRLRLEASRNDFIPFFAAATNPGGKAHAEVRKYYVTKTASAEQYPDYNPNRICFIPANVYDNKILLDRDPEVLKRLQQLPYKEQQKYLFGNWDIFEGQFFDNWNPEVHIIKKENYLDYNQIKQMSVLGGLDYGNVTILILGAKDYNGNVILFDELYHEKETREKKVKDTKKFLTERGLENITIVADTNMWNPDAFDMSGQEFPAAYYLRAGIKLIKVSKNISGLNNKSYRKACNDAFYDALDYEFDYEKNKFIKQPKLKVYERCKYFIDTFPLLITDDKDVEDIADGQDDHAYDAAKYLYMQLTKPKQKTTDNEPTWLIEMRKERLKKIQTDFMGV